MKGAGKAAAASKPEPKPAAAPPAKKPTTAPKSGRPATAKVKHRVRDRPVEFKCLIKLDCSKKKVRIHSLVFCSVLSRNLANVCLIKILILKSVLF